MRTILRHRCDVYRARVSNDRGFESKDWALVIRSLPCLLQEGKGQTIRDKHGQETRVDGVLYIPRNKDVLPRRDDDQQDRIIMTRPDGPAGIFLVQFVADEGGLTDVGRLGCLKCYVQRTRPEVPPL